MIFGKKNDRDKKHEFNTHTYIYAGTDGISAGYVICVFVWRDKAIVAKEQKPFAIIVGYL